MRNPQNCLTPFPGPVLLVFAGSLFWSLLCWGSQSQLSICVVSCALDFPGQVAVGPWSRDTGPRLQCQGPLDHIRFIPKIYTLSTGPIPPYLSIRSENKYDNVLVYVVNSQIDMSWAISWLHQNHHCACPQQSIWNVSMNCIYVS